MLRRLPRPFLPQPFLLPLFSVWRKDGADELDSLHRKMHWLCPHMQRITLKGIRTALETGRHEISVDPAIADRARLAVERMVNLKQ